jgi:hypothetical protein
MAPPVSTRLMLYGPDGARITLDARNNRVAGMDITGPANADAKVPLRVVIERECNLGEWHAIANGPLPLYDPDHDVFPPPP